MFTALLDTNVLWPSMRRDFLLSLAVEGLYRPVWSSRLLEEIEYVECAKLIKKHGLKPVEAAERAARLVGEIRRAFDDAEVDGWESLDGTFGLRDPNDEHVAAAAVIAGAGVIVTDDKDFEQHLLQPHGIEVLPPDVFATNTVAVDPRRALVAVEKIASRSGKQGDKFTTTQLLDRLDERYGFQEATALIRQVQQDDSGESDPVMTT